MEAIYTFVDVVFDSEKGELSVGGRSSHLRPQTGAVLTCLLNRARKVVTKDELLREVWTGIVVTENSLSQCIREIRRELGDAKETLVRTVPRRGYLLEADVVRREAVPDAAGHSAAKTGMDDGRLTIIVLPLVNVDGDRDQDYFADGLTEDLTTDIGRLPSAFVISRGTAYTYRDRVVDVREIGRQLGVRYAVEGSVRRHGDEVVVNLSLSDTTSSAQLWAERFEGSRADLPELQRSMTSRIAQGLHLKLFDAEAGRLERAGALNPASHDLALRAWSLWYRSTATANAEAKLLLQKAIELDSNCALAWMVLSNSHIMDIALRWTSDPAKSLASAEVAACKALSIAPDHPTANTPFGVVLVYRKRFEEALGVFATQMSLNANFSIAHQWIGITHVLMGNPQLAIGPIEFAIHLSPRDPRLSTYYRNVAVAHLHAGDDAKALIFAERSVRLPNPWARSYETLAAVYGATGLVEDSQAAVVELLRLWPGYTIAQHRAEMISDRPAFLAQHARYIDGLKIAGLTDA